MSSILDEKERIVARLEECKEISGRRWDCVPLDGMPRDPWPGSTMIYTLSDSVGRVLRVGHTKQKLGVRVSQYRQEPWYPEVEEVCCTVVESGEETKKVEKASVGCTCPIYNKYLKKPYCPID